MTGDGDRVLGLFSLPKEIERFRPTDDKSGRRAESLVRTDHLRVLLVTLRQGASLHEHTAPGPITIQAVKGDLRVQVEGDEIPLAAGGLVAIAAHTPHAVHAQSDGAFLLTISLPDGPAPIAAEDEGEGEV
jgi:quercetin dioxygenase-like cupin family protein